MVTALFRGSLCILDARLQFLDLGLEELILVRKRGDFLFLCKILLF